MGRPKRPVLPDRPWRSNPGDRPAPAAPGSPRRFAPRDDDPHRPPNLSSLPRRDDLDPVAGLEPRARARSRRHELAVERGFDPGFAIVERLQSFRERGGADVPRFPVNDELHANASARSNAIAAARSANAGESRNPWRYKPLTKSRPSCSSMRGSLLGKAGRTPALISTISASPKAGWSA